MKLAIMPNPSRDKGLFHTGRLVEKLGALGAETVIHSDYKSYLQNRKVSFCDDTAQMLRGCDAIVAVGGDGTIIHCAHHAADAGKPILGVNVGRLGFVAGLETDEFDELGKLVSGNYTVQERMLLEVRVPSENGEKTFTALNDAVLSRGSFSRMLDLKVRYGGDRVFSYRADGLIVSTPTGSTAYSLSAGGPVVDPDMNCILLSPLCPHSLFSRTVVFGPDARLGVQADEGEQGEILLTVDGETPVRFTGRTGDIRFCRSEKTVGIIKLKDIGFFEIVNQKLGLV